MKVRITKRGNKYLAEYRQMFLWKTLSHYEPFCEWSTITYFDSPEKALEKLKRLFQKEVVYEGEL